jgi:hypothetical protein
MSPRARRVGVLFGGIGAGIAVLLFSHRPAQAQGMVRPEGDGEFHFSTKVGSFKLLGTEDKDVTGHLEFTGKGTVLISGVDNPPATTGTLKLEYSYLPLKKYCFHGSGSFKLDGSWRSVQWFGSDLTGNFKGRGKFRLVGEFDKDLNTGVFWTTDPNKKNFWPPNSVLEYLVPGYSSTVTKPKAINQPAPGMSAK